LSYAVNSNDSTFFNLFGRKEFIPLINTVKAIAPTSMFTGVAYKMFHYLFNWTDAEWDKSYKNAYFQFTPRPTSTKALAHWFQIARNGNVLRPFETESAVNLGRLDSGLESESSEGDSFDISCIRCPVAIVYGEKDKIVDSERLINEFRASCGNLVLAECIKGYEHMDVIWGKTAKALVFDKLIKTLGEL